MGKYTSSTIETPTEPHRATQQNVRDGDTDTGRARYYRVCGRAGGMQRTQGTCGQRDQSSRAAAGAQGMQRGGIFHYFRYNNINNLGQLIDVFINLFLNSPDLRRAK